MAKEAAQEVQKDTGYTPKVFISSEFFDQIEERVIIEGIIKKSWSEFMGKTHSVIHLPNGGFFVLPEELEAFRAADPTRARFYERQREQDPPAALPDRQLTINLSKYDPRLDPGAPEFDPQAYSYTMFFQDKSGYTPLEISLREWLTCYEDFIAYLNTLNTANSAADDLKEVLHQSPFGAIPLSFNLPEITEKAKDIEETPAAFTEVLKKNAGVISAITSGLIDTMKTAAEAIEETKELYPFLQEEIDKENEAHPDKEPITLETVLRAVDIYGEPIKQIGDVKIDNPFADLVDRAKQRMKQENALEIIQAVSTRSHSMINSTLINALQRGQKSQSGGKYKGIIGEPAFDMPIELSKKIVTNFTMITDHNEGDLKYKNGKMTENDRQVFDAICTLCLAAEQQNLPPIFNVDQIYQAMPGGGTRASRQQRELITNALVSMSNLDIEYDATNELQEKNIIGKDKEFLLEGKCLYWKKGTYKAKNGGQKYEAYQILDQPLILTHALKTNQIITTPTKNIEIKKVKNGKATTEIIPMSASRQAMTGYMLRRISIMKRDLEEAQKKLRSYNKHREKDPTLEEKNLSDFRKQSSTILFETLFNETGTTTTDRKQTGLNRDFCFSVLDYWKTTKLIADYKKQEKGRSITGIIILLDHESLPT